MRRHALQGVAHARLPHWERNAGSKRKTVEGGRRRSMIQRDISRWSALFAVAALLALAGCGGNEQEQSGGTGSSTGASTGGAPGGNTAGGTAAGNAKPLKLAFVTNNASDFWTIARA